MQDVTIFISHHPFLVGAALLILILLTIVEVSRKKLSQQAISPQELTQLINHQNAVIIDIRQNDAFNKGHVIDSISMDTTALSENKKLEKYKKRPIVIVDQSGNEAGKIANQLASLGYQTYALSGGIQAWINADMPIVKG